MRFPYFLIEKYRSVTNMVGTILISWILSAIVGQVIGYLLPSSKTVANAFSAISDEEKEDFSLLMRSDAMTVAYYSPICERNIFSAQHRGSCVDEAPLLEEEVGPRQDLNAPPIKSDLSATLLGTMVSTNPKVSFATISTKNGKDSANYHIDDMIMEEGKIYDIQRNRVYFIRNGHKEYIEIPFLPAITDSSGSISSYGNPSPSPTDGIKRMGDKLIISRAKVDSTLGDLNQVIQQSRMVPNYEGGVVNGFKIFAIRPGSIFDELGLKNGDVVQRINGTEIDDVSKALPMLQLLKAETSSISIDITRGGTKKTLTIDIR